ncbi:MAG: DinB family protein [Anaerolineaceae bacterium]|nr:DinB family protein [Anaerolineaceae bacterium]
MFQRFLRHFLLERPGQKWTMSAWGEKLTASGEKIERRLQKAPDSERNRQVLSHIVGIELWGQSRLRVGLGEPFKEDDYDSYRPSRSRTWEQLKAEFRLVRKKSVALAEALDDNMVDQFMKVKHNRYGMITLGAWLRYLDMHANAESKRIKT